tara:strand:- start:85 stop:972 length:888 start_codon:yes stop_codon:yes gene_type:complete
MGLGLSRKIRSYRELSLDIIKRKNINIYKFLLLVGAFFKFISKINRRKNSRKYSENLDEINNFEYSITSQNNEDGIINYIFKKLKVFQPNFVEIGLDYYENNSLALLRKSNKGLFIDGDNKKIFLLKNILKIVYPFKKFSFVSEFINKKNINLLISQTFRNDEEIDFMSIDVDGIDYYLLEEVSFYPKLICIEYNFWYGKNVKCSVPYNENFRWKMGSLYSGASLLALNDLLNSKGYHLIALDSGCVNAFFIRDDLKENFKILDPIKSFKEPLKYDKKDIDKGRKDLLKSELVYF